MNPYLEQAILNADPVELIRVIYKQAIVWVREARQHLRNKRIAERSAAIMRAYANLAELIASLRPEKAPELARLLRRLYVYMQQRLLQANQQQADGPLEEVLGLLVELEDAWAGVAAQLAPAREAASEPEAPPVEPRRNGWYRAGQATEERTGGLALSA
jgi:flagellar protein FliS